MKGKPEPSKQLLVVLVVFACQSVLAGEADVLSVKVKCKDSGTCSFAVTVMHADQGWDHYANGWEVLDASGNVIAERELLHPHDNEQPFTRSLNNVKIPEGLLEVTIRAHDSVHGLGGKELTVNLDR